MSNRNLPAVREQSNALVVYGASAAEIEAANRRREKKRKERIRAWCAAALIILSSAVICTGELQAAGRITDNHLIVALIWYMIAVLALGWIVERFAPEDDR